MHRELQWNNFHWQLRWMPALFNGVMSCKSWWDTLLFGAVVNWITGHILAYTKIAFWSYQMSGGLGLGGWTSPAPYWNIGIYQVLPQWKAWTCRFAAKLASCACWLNCGCIVLIFAIAVFLSCMYGCRVPNSTPRLYINLEKSSSGVRLMSTTLSICVRFSVLVRNLFIGRPTFKFSYLDLDTMK